MRDRDIERGYSESEHEGLDALFGDSDSPSEPIVESEPEPVVHTPTVISKLKGSVDVPEEFKFSDDTTFYSMLRNRYNEPKC
jgi:hypothetical protein